MLSLQKKITNSFKENSKRNSKAHPYITCSDAKVRGCYPFNMNYEKFEKHIIGIVKKIFRIYADKEVFAKVFEKYQIKLLI